MRASLLLCLVLAAASCARPRPPAVAQPPATHPDGLVTQVLAPGDGDVAKAGDKVTVHYVGTLLDGGVFDSSRERDQPFSFWLGEGQVIQGWEEGVLGMREREVRRLTVPAALGYGSDAKPKIPAGSVLVFEVELINVR